MYRYIALFFFVFSLFISNQGFAENSNLLYPQSLTDFQKQYPNLFGEKMEPIPNSILWVQKEIDPHLIAEIAPQVSDFHTIAIREKQTVANVLLSYYPELKSHSSEKINQILQYLSIFQKNTDVSNRIKDRSNAFLQFQNEFTAFPFSPSELSNPKSIMNHPSRKGFAGCPLTPQNSIQDRNVIFGCYQLYKTAISKNRNMDPMLYPISFQTKTFSNDAATTARYHIAIQEQSSKGKSTSHPSFFVGTVDDYFTMNPNTSGNLIPKDGLDEMEAIRKAISKITWGTCLNIAEAPCFTHRFNKQQYEALLSPRSTWFSFLLNERKFTEKRFGFSLLDLLMAPNSSMNTNNSQMLYDFYNAFTSISDLKRQGVENQVYDQSLYLKTFAKTPVLPLARTYDAKSKQYVIIYITQFGELIQRVVKKEELQAYKKITLQQLPFVQLGIFNGKIYTQFSKQKNIIIKQQLKFGLDVYQEKLTTTSHAAMDLLTLGVSSFTNPDVPFNLAVTGFLMNFIPMGRVIQAGKEMVLVATRGAKIITLDASRFSAKQLERLNIISPDQLTRIQQTIHLAKNKSISTTQATQYLRHHSQYTIKSSADLPVFTGSCKLTTISSQKNAFVARIASFSTNCKVIGKTIFNNQEMAIVFDGNIIKLDKQGIMKGDLPHLKLFANEELDGLHVATQYFYNAKDIGVITLKKKSGEIIPVPLQKLRKEYINRTWYYSILDGQQMTPIFSINEADMLGSPLSLFHKQIPNYITKTPISPVTSIQSSVSTSAIGTQEVAHFVRAIRPDEFPAKNGIQPTMSQETFDELTRETTIEKLIVRWIQNGAASFGGKTPFISTSNSANISFRFWRNNQIKKDLLIKIKQIKSLENPKLEQIEITKYINQLKALNAKDQISFFESKLHEMKKVSKQGKPEYGLDELEKDILTCTKNASSNLMVYMDAKKLMTDPKVKGIYDVSNPSIMEKGGYFEGNVGATTSGKALASGEAVIDGSISKEAIITTIPYAEIRKLIDPTDPTFLALSSDLLKKSPDLKAYLATKAPKNYEWIMKNPNKSRPIMELNKTLAVAMNDLDHPNWYKIGEFLMKKPNYTTLDLIKFLGTLK